MLPSDTLTAPNLPSLRVPDGDTSNALCVDFSLPQTNSVVIKYPLLTVKERERMRRRIAESEAASVGNGNSRVKRRRIKPSTRSVDLNACDSNQNFRFNKYTCIP